MNNPVFAVQIEGEKYSIHCISVISVNVKNSSHHIAERPRRHNVGLWSIIGEKMNFNSSDVSVCLSVCLSEMELIDRLDPK